MHCKVVNDIYKAYHHVEVDEDTKKLQTISTHMGTFKVNRLSQGVKTAPNEFQRVMSKILSNLEGVVSYFDDIVVFGKDFEECQKRLIALLDRLKAANLHLSREKCQFFKSQINYCGHSITEEGIGKTDKHIRAVAQAPRPKSVDEVRTFLGMVAYYSKFIPDAATLTFPLRQLLCKNRKFYWSDTCESSFLKIKEELSSDRVLVPFNPDHQIVVACDASPTGISGILSHRINGVEKPVAYASRSLTAAERNYSQLDREATAIYWSVQKFFLYIYGRKFILVTDNEPLSRIFKQDAQLPSITALRLLRYAVFLSGFQYEIRHKKGEANKNADYLSRAPLPETVTEDSENEIYVHSVDSISTSRINYKSIVEETGKDEKLKELRDNLQSGKIADENFSLLNGAIFRGQCVYVPESLRKAVLVDLHETHSGIVKMKGLARKYVYWPSLNSDIESLVKSCQVCAENQRNPPKAELHPWEPAEKPFDRVHIDYAGPFQGHHFFILVDAYSKWPEIVPISAAPTSTSTMRILSKIFCRQGYPNSLVSDNASYFTSAEFIEFLESKGIQRRLSPPGHPATNGLAERYVQILKRKLKAMVEEQGSIESKVQKILLRFRVTPLSNNKSPAEQFLGRQLEFSLDMLKPPVQCESKPVYKPRVRSYQVGERVLSRSFDTPEKWKFGVVKSKLGNVIYMVQLDNGKVYKRHYNQLRSTSVKKAVTFNPNPAVQHYYPRQRSSSRLTSRPSQTESKSQPKQQATISTLRRSNRERHQPVRYGDPISSNRK